MTAAYPGYQPAKATDVAVLAGQVTSVPRLTLQPRPATLRGRVARVDRAIGGHEGVLLAVLDTDCQTLSAADGTYVLASATCVPPGARQVHATAAGYLPVTSGEVLLLPGGEAELAELSLLPDADGDGLAAAPWGPDCDDGAASCREACVDVDQDATWDCRDACVDADQDGFGLGDGCSGAVSTVER